MSYTTNTPFSLVTIDSESGNPLSPEALDQRKRLILLWKIQKQQLDCLEFDLNSPVTHTEKALSGEEAIDTLRTLMRWHGQAMSYPILRIERLEELSTLGAAVVASPPLPR